MALERLCVVSAEPNICMSISIPPVYPFTILAPDVADVIFV